MSYHEECIQEIKVLMEKLGWEDFDDIRFRERYLCIGEEVVIYSDYKTKALVLLAGLIMSYDCDYPLPTLTLNDYCGEDQDHYAIMYSIPKDYDLKDFYNLLKEINKQYP